MTPRIGSVMALSGVLPSGQPHRVSFDRDQRASAENPIPTARLVNRAQLWSHLTGDVPDVDARRREEEIRLRQRHAGWRGAP